MIKTFFEIETDAPLKISTDQEAMTQQGQYPVILFNLKETKGSDYKEIENKGL
jgi:hypothetical protein